MARVTGVPSLDNLVQPVPESGWVVEFYGERRLAGLVGHHAIAEAARRGLVAVVHVQEFGGLDPFLVQRLARARGASVDNILVARAFRLVDVPKLLADAVETGAKTIVVVDPYLYSPATPIAYDRLTPLTAALRRAAGDALVVVVNRHSKFGRWRPEGGNFHHHSVHVMVRLHTGSRGVLAELVKHPAKRVPERRHVSWQELGVAWLWAGPRPLQEDL